MQTKVVKEIKKGERVYQFILDTDSPVGEAIDVAIEIWSYLNEVSKKAIEKAKNSEDNND